MLRWFRDQPLHGRRRRRVLEAIRGRAAKTFNPRKFYPQDWRFWPGWRDEVRVFTTKHHAGFCMFHTATTDFGVLNTPFRRDITAEIVAAFREQGVAPGFYFSPDDFCGSTRTARPSSAGRPMRSRPTISADGPRPGAGDGAAHSLRSHRRGFLRRAPEG